MNFIVRLPRLQPVTDCTASVAHRSISTNTISVFRSAPFGSPMPAFLRPSMDILTPRTWPGQRCPWIRADSLRSVLPLVTSLPKNPGQQLLTSLPILPLRAYLCLNKLLLYFLTFLLCLQILSRRTSNSLGNLPSPLL